MFSYKIYGLTLRSNLVLDGLPKSLDTSVDIFVDLSDKEHITTSKYKESLVFESDKSFYLWTQKRNDGEYLRLRFSRDNKGYVQFIINPTGTHVWSTRKDVPLKNVITFLQSQVMSCILRLRNHLCLHASVVNTEDGAICFVGESGQGKSSTAAALSQMGCPTISDDLAAITKNSNQLWVQPGYPRLRLTPQSINKFYGSEQQLSLIMDGMEEFEKRYLELNIESETWKFCPTAQPLTAIYLLEKRSSQNSSTRVETIASVDRLISVIPHLSLNFLPLDKDRRAQEFKNLCELVNTVPIRRLERPDDLDALPQVCKTILEDVSMLKNARNN